MTSPSLSICALFSISTTTITLEATNSSLAATLTPFHSVLHLTEGFFSFISQIMVLLPVTPDTSLTWQDLSSANLQLILYNSPSSLNPFPISLCSRPTGLLSVSQKCYAPSCHRMFAQAVVFGTFPLPFFAYLTLNLSELSPSDTSSRKPFLTSQSKFCSSSNAQRTIFLFFSVLFSVTVVKSLVHLKGCLHHQTVTQFLPTTESQRLAHQVAHSRDSVNICRMNE